MWLTFLIVIVVDWSGSSDAPWKAHWRSGSQPQVMVKSLIRLQKDPGHTPES